MVMHQTVLREHHFMCYNYLDVDITHISRRLLIVNH